MYGLLQERMIARKGKKVRRGNSTSRGVIGRRNAKNMHKGRLRLHAKRGSPELKHKATEKGVRGNEMQSED